MSVMFSQAAAKANAATASGTVGRMDGFSASLKEGLVHHVVGGRFGQSMLRRRLRLFRRKRPGEEFVAVLYTRTAENARAPELFQSCGIPDTLDGRFDALALHAALMIDRLRSEPDGEPLAQSFFDAMFRHLDLTLREIGVQDLGVGRRIKIMAEGLHGRALAYRAALTGGTVPLGEILRRNAYGGRAPTDEQVACLEVRVRDYVERLAAAGRRELLDC
jgi:cytochrome b pre-mRNA-processing protein 3